MVERCSSRRAHIGCGLGPCSEPTPRGCGIETLGFEYRFGECKCHLRVIGEFTRLPFEESTANHFPNTVDNGLGKCPSVEAG